MILVVLVLWEFYDWVWPIVVASLLWGAIMMLCMHLAGPREFLRIVLWDPFK